MSPQTVMAITLSERFAVKAGPQFGLTRESQNALVHFAVVYNIPEVGKGIKSCCNEATDKTATVVARSHSDQFPVL